MFDLAPMPAPAVRAPRLSLVSLARDPIAAGVTEYEGDWRKGFAYLPLCGTAGRFDRCTHEPMVPPDPPPLLEFVPYVVWAASDCNSTFGQVSDPERARAQQRAADALTACESSQIEDELWGGATAQAQAETNPENPWPNRWLASPDTVDLGDGDPVEALACLERALAGCACGRRGMIHATADTVTWWSRYNLLRAEGATLLTVNDTVVVPGAGYDGSGPDGPVESGAWAYATGMVDVRRSAVIATGGQVDTRTNSATFYAQRFAAATWDGCCAFGVHVQFDSCTAGS